MQALVQHKQQKLSLLVVLLLTWHAVGIEEDASVQQLKHQQGLKYQQALQLR
jgi:hypothetical protein